MNGTTGTYPWLRNQDRLGQGSLFDLCSGWIWESQTPESQIPHLSGSCTTYQLPESLENYLKDNDYSVHYARIGENYDDYDECNYDSEKDELDIYPTMLRHFEDDYVEEQLKKKDEYFRQLPTYSKQKSCDHPCWLPCKKELFLTSHRANTSVISQSLVYPNRWCTPSVPREIIFVKAINNMKTLS